MTASRRIRAEDVIAGDVVDRDTDNVVLEVARVPAKGCGGGYTFLHFRTGQVKYYDGETVAVRAFDTE